MDEEIFYDIVSNGKILIQKFIEKYKITQVLKYNPNVFDEILENYQSFNLKSLLSLHEHLELFDTIYNLYNNFNSVFKEIEKINNNLISKKIMDDNYKKYIQNIYSGFESGLISTNSSFEKKIEKLNKDFKKLENEQKKSNNKINELVEELNKEKKKSNNKINELTEKLKISEEKVTHFEKRLSMLENGLKIMTEDLECPITGQIFKKPVVAPSGNTYEEKEIKDWIKRGKNDPKSNRPLNENQLYPNLNLGNIIEKYNEINNKIDNP